MFTFKFESSLNYRKAIEEKKLFEFSEENKKLEREKKLLLEIQQEQAMIIEQFKNMQQQPFDSSDVALYLSYIASSKEKEDLQKEHIRKVSFEVETLKKALLDAVKDRKIMDNLKERHLREYNESMAMYERKSADETAVLSYIRNKQ